MAGADDGKLSKGRLDGQITEYRGIQREDQTAAALMGGSKQTHGRYQAWLERWSPVVASHACMYESN